MISVQELSTEEILQLNLREQQFFIMVKVEKYEIKQYQQKWEKDFNKEILYK